jgi:hypothetical protein
MHRRSKISVLQASMKAWTNNRAICAFIWRVAGAGSARLRMKANDAILGCQTASLSLHVVLGSAAGAAPLSGWSSRCLNHCASVALPASCSASSFPPFRPSPRWQDKVPTHGVLCRQPLVVVGANKAQRRSLFTPRAHARINTSRQTKIIMTSPAAACVFAVLPLAGAGLLIQTIRGVT